MEEAIRKSEAVLRREREKKKDEREKERERERARERERERERELLEQEEVDHRIRVDRNIDRNDRER